MRTTSVTLVLLLGIHCAHAETWSLQLNRAYKENQATTSAVKDVFKNAAQGETIDEKIALLGEELRQIDRQNIILPAGLVGFANPERANRGIYADPAFRKRTAIFIDEGAQGRFYGRSYGKVQPTGMFKECVAVGRDDEYHSTGIIIQDDLVLTAAHICDNDAGAIPNMIWIGNTTPNCSDRDTSKPLPPGTSLKISRYYRHKNYKGSYESPKGNDIMLLQIAPEDRTKVSCLGKIATLQELESTGTKEIRIVGYGNNRMDAHQHLIGYGKRRQGQIAGGISWNPIFNLYSEASSPDQRPLEFASVDILEEVDTCKGDSGGPLYLEVSQGKFKIIGITSRRIPGDGLPCGPGGIYTCAPAYNDWIKAAYASVKDWPEVE